MIRDTARVVCLVLLSASTIAQSGAWEGRDGGAAAEQSLRVVQFSHVPLRDQDSREVRFPEDLFGDRLVVLNFVFTRCGTICPPMGAAFGRLQAELAARPELPVDLISISLDPVQDTPDRLKSWAERFGRKPGWTLLTGAKPDVDLALKSLDAFAAERSRHAALVLVGDPKSDRWLRIDGLASPQEMLGAITQLIKSPAGPAAALR